MGKLGERFAELREQILVGNPGVSDMRRDIRAFHYDTDFRIVTGGTPTWFPPPGTVGRGAPNPAAARAKGSLQRLISDTEAEAKAAASEAGRSRVPAPAPATSIRHALDQQEQHGRPGSAASPEPDLAPGRRVFF